MKNTHCQMEPTFTETEGPGAYRLNEPPVEREAVMVIAKHWSSESYLCLRKNDGSHTLVTGGIDTASGKSAEETARDEIHEEAGYRHILVRRILETRVHDRFFHTEKNENRIAHFTVVYCIVTDDTRDSVCAAEQALHTGVWIKYEDMKTVLSHESHAYVWKSLFLHGA